MIEINGKRQPGQPYEAERFAIGCRALSNPSGQNEAIREIGGTVGLRLIEGVLPAR